MPKFRHISSATIEIREHANLKAAMEAEGRSLLPLMKRGWTTMVDEEDGTIRVFNGNGVPQTRMHRRVLPVVKGDDENEAEAIGRQMGNRTAPAVLVKRARQQARA